MTALTDGSFSGMDQGMVGRAIAHDKVLWPVVRSVAIDVVDDSVLR